MANHEEAKCTIPRGRGARGVVLSSLASLGLLLAASAAHATSGYLNTWSTTYPSSTSDNNASCQLCHGSSTQNLNPYGKALCDQGRNTAIGPRIAAVAGLNSDADPTNSSNLVETNANTQPGWTPGTNNIFSRGTTAGGTASCTPNGSEAAPTNIGALDPTPAACNIAVNPTTLAFGTVTRPNSSSLNTTVTNTGTAACNVNLVKTGSADFAITSATSFTLAPSANSTVSVSYTPSDVGGDTGQVAVTSQAPTVNVALTGNGVVNPEICNDGIDNDLDGLADCADPDCNGFQNGACTTGQPGICSAGTLTCQNLAQVCVQNQQPVTEAPPGSAICQDGLDNDCDGFTDSNDTGCQFPPETACFDGIDNNGDGLIDCADPTCANVVGPATSCGTGACAATGNRVCQNLTEVNTCTAGTPGTEGPPGDATCSDGIDNDCDGLTDLADPTCVFPAESNCFDGIDNNGDGNIDCADPTCNNVTGPATSCGTGICAASGNLTCVNGQTTDTCQAGTPGTEGPFYDPSCSDGLDNNCDGLTDAADPNCAVVNEGNCFDGIDNNGDGLVDCADPTCEGVTGPASTCGTGVCASTGNLSCSGGQQVDSCQPGPAGTEGPAGTATCSDGLDNDCDGLTDANDPDCVTPEICDNGIDDDLDGLADCADPDCAGFQDGPCQTGQPGVCADGTFTCQNLTQVCVPNQQPGVEGPPGDPTCSDSLDNDCDGFTDSADVESCVVPPESNCFDGIDNNNDGLTDCADPTCANVVGPVTTCGTGVCAASGNLVCFNGQQTNTCQAGTPGTEGPFGQATCTDGLDNDCDGLTDAADPDCAAPPEVCDNGVDDNGNGLIDCQDPQCIGTTYGACDTGQLGICAAGTLTCDGSTVGPVCVQNQQAGTEGPSGSASCSDGLDNDCDGLTDADDPDCAAPAADVFLTSLSVPNKVNGKVGQVINKTASAKGDGTLITQDATVTLSAAASPGIGVVIVPQQLTAPVIPGNPQTQYRWFTLFITCEAPGTGTIDWTASISAASNSDPNNDVQTGTTSVTCR